LVGGSSSNKGNVMAYNPSTGIEGPVCDDDWEMKDVSNHSLMTSCA